MKMKVIYFDLNSLVLSNTSYLLFECYMHAAPEATIVLNRFGNFKMSVLHSDRITMRDNEITFKSNIRK